MPAVEIITKTPAYITTWGTLVSELQQDPWLEFTVLYKDELRTIIGFMDERSFGKSVRYVNMRTDGKLRTYRIRDYLPVAVLNEKEQK
jgi:hypothetical protein